MAVSPPSQRVPQSLLAFVMILLHRAAHQDGQHGDPGYPNSIDQQTGDFALSWVLNL
jgi:hypothetical protein